MLARVKARASRLWRDFKLTLSDWDLIFSFQGKVCAICQKKKHIYHTDHDHETGMIRGILCSQCNRALGKAQDPRWQWTPQCFLNAYRYLSRPPAVDALQRKAYTFPGRLGTKRHRDWLKQNRATLETPNEERKT